MITMTNTTHTYPTVADYIAADRSAKSAMRTMVDDAMRDAIRTGDIAAATVAMATLDAYRSAVAASRTTGPTADDIAAMVAARVATLRAAADAIADGTVIPAGVPDDMVPTPDAIAAAMGSVVVDTTDRDAIAAARVVRSRRHALRDAIADAMASHYGDGRYVRVADIRNAIRTDTDGDYVPSAGAIAAAITSDTGVPNVAMVAADGDRPLGARYVG